MGLFILSYLKFGLSWTTVFSMIICSCLIIMTMTDLKEKLVDCNIAIGLAVIGFIYNFIFHHSILDTFLGLLAGILIMELVARTGYLIGKGRAFGEADTYVAGALGACFGLLGGLQVLLYTLFASMLFVIPMFLYKQYKNNNKAVCILFILFILSALLFKTIVQNWLTFALVVGLGLTLAFFVLRNLKQDEEPMYLPLVPAFSLAALYFLFF
jgi:Flp pilus assembly protein protease CpaA